MQVASGICLGFLLIMLCSGSAFATDTKQIALVKDTQGKAFTVTNLYANYTVRGMGMGNFLDRNLPNLQMIISSTKDRVRTTETIIFDFEKIHSIVLKNPDIPEEVKTELSKGASSAIRIELRNGTFTIFGPGNLFQFGADGKMLKKTKFDSYGIYFIRQDKSYFLHGFGGRSKTENGKEGDFWISDSETSSIYFQ